MVIGVVKETFPGENRVALIPDSLTHLIKAGAEILIETGAGEKAGFSNSAYEEKGASVLSERQDVFSKADIILQVRSFGSNREEGRTDLKLMKKDQIIIGLMDPLSEPDAAKEISSTGVKSFSMELMPRITRAQSMDTLSSMATIAGYKAVLIAADHLPKMFPMMMTAAGTISPAKVFVIGAGVAGLQAIASAKRLGAIVHAYDVRPAVKEQVESLGGRFVEMELDAQESEDKGGYAKAMDEKFYRKQREMMMNVVSVNDVVITTAAIPGRKSPILVTKEMVEKMQPGSVIVDLAAERGGNCEVTEPGKTIIHNGVTVIGPLNIPTTIPTHASQMYAKNIQTFVMAMIKEGKIELDMEDEIIKETLVTDNGEVVNDRIKELISN